jgi:four helix bundle protein
VWLSAKIGSVTSQNYRNLVAWRQAMALVRLVYPLTRKWPAEELYGLTSQLRRSCISIPSNIAEGYGRRSDKELARFLQIANGSLMEAETQLLLARDLGYLPKPELDTCLSAASELGRVINGLLHKVSG